MNFWKKRNKKGDKIYFHYDFGRGKGQRPVTGVFVYTKPKNQIEKNHNKEALALLETKKSELILDRQAIGSSFMPSHKFKSNFLDYYEEYVRLNKKENNRHVQGSLNHFREFLNKEANQDVKSISPLEITENLCKRYRQYLLDNFNGDTPANYYARFKRCMAAATKDGYYRINPCEDVKSKTNPSKNLKEILEVDEYLLLLKTPFFNQEIAEAFIFCCYTGLRYVDVYTLSWGQIKENKLVTRIIQAKTGQPVELTLHPIAKAILKRRKENKPEADPNEKIFLLLTNDGCNKALQQWVDRARIKKHITWSCARLSFSILLQDQLVDNATVAYLLGHTSTEHVNRTYKRHRPKDQSKTIDLLPSPDLLPYFLQL
ncbi:site-specific integrase [Paraflavitalea sp. CAU 1676]|uniref:site-specific integrase n=1 Tax=Paraflavitalea sp. CAU 1676 TaxID=3032598 RepID=UPI0023DB41DE|nr:site-specific integrase [Paraflavitalea sp. CAU 1676]MDF2190559.1 site-specific integrase [Paraflavitalea sp. CAU 1676]